MAERDDRNIPGLRQLGQPRHERSRFIRLIHVDPTLHVGQQRIDNHDADAMRVDVPLDELNDVLVKAQEFGQERDTAEIGVHAHEAFDERGLRIILGTHKEHALRPDFALTGQGRSR